MAATEHLWLKPRKCAPITIRAGLGINRGQDILLTLPQSPGEIVIWKRLAGFTSIKPTFAPDELDHQ